MDIENIKRHATNMPDVNLYRDEHSGGWILEVLALGEWYRVGVFGTREQLLDKVSKL